MQQAALAIPVSLPFLLLPPLASTSSLSLDPDRDLECDSSEELVREREGPTVSTVFSGDCGFGDLRDDIVMERLNERLTERWRGALAV